MHTATTFLRDPDNQYRSGFIYGRPDNATVRQVEAVLAALAQVEAALVGFSGLSPHYQIVLTREGTLDAMMVDVELDPDARNSEADRDRKAQDVRHHLKSLIGVTCNVAVRSPGEVPRSQGKAVRVRDLRNKTN